MSLSNSQRHHGQISPIPPSLRSLMPLLRSARSTVHCCLAICVLLIIRAPSCPSSGTCHFVIHPVTFLTRPEYGSLPVAGEISGPVIEVGSERRLRSQSADSPLLSTWGSRPTFFVDHHNAASGFTLGRDQRFQRLYHLIAVRSCLIRFTKTSYPPSALFVGKPPSKGTRGA